MQPDSTPGSSESLLTRMHNAISELSCYIIIIYKTRGKSRETVGQESLTMPFWLICSFPRFHPTGFVSSALGSIPQCTMLPLEPTSLNNKSYNSKHLHH